MLIGHSRTLAVATAHLGVLAGSAAACWIPSRSQPPATYRRISDPITITYFVEVDVLPTTASMNCTGGIGVQPLPPSVGLIGTGMGVYNFATDVFTTIPEFVPMNTFFNESSRAGWEAGPAVPDPARGAPEPGLNWIGWGGTIAPVSPPPLGPNEIYAIVFSFVVGLDYSEFNVRTQIGGGLADANLAPVFLDPLAAPAGLATYSPVFELQVPGPQGALALLICAAPGLRRRR